MNERGTEIFPLFQYLHKSNQVYAELNLYPFLNFGRMNKITIISIVASLVRLPENITSKSEVEMEVGQAINDEINAQITVKTQTMKNITSVIKKECYILKLKESGDRILKDAIKI